MYSISERECPNPCGKLYEIQVHFQLQLKFIVVHRVTLRSARHGPLLAPIKLRLETNGKRQILILILPLSPFCTKYNCCILAHGNSFKMRFTFYYSEA